jgi:hypothetical protein
MSVQPDVARLSVREFLDRIHSDLVPLSSQFSYFTIPSALGEDDLREYLADPVAALPPSLCALLPRVAFLLVPHLERVNGKPPGRNGSKNGKPSKNAKERRAPDPVPEDFVSFEKPSEGRGIASTLWIAGTEAAILLAVQDQEMADYHFELYHQLASLAGEIVPPDRLHDFRALLREELTLRVHGEVDDKSWQLKQALQRRQTNMKRDTKGFRDYSLMAFVDTLTLYLHGICCDIDVETGPRQLPSRHLRRRLRLLRGLFPPPEGYAVLPEDVDSEKPQ